MYLTTLLILILISIKNLECRLACVCVNVSDLVIARLSHSLGKVAVHQRLVDKDGLIYSLESLAGQTNKKILNMP